MSSDSDKKFKIVTDGTIERTQIFNEDGELMGGCSSVEMKPREYMTIVNVGDETYRPTPADLTQYKEVFEAAKGDPDCIIFTNNGVKVTRIPKDDKAILNWNFEMLLR